MIDAEIKQEARPRATVEIYLPGDKVLSGPRGTRLETFLKTLPEWRHPQIVGAVVNNHLRELTMPVEMDARVTPLDITTPDGARIYRRSLTFLLEAAFEDLFPDVELSVDHSVSSGGFFCEIVNRQPMTDEELARLQDHMHHLVDQDIPFDRQEVPLAEAIDYFTMKGELDKVRLIKYRQKKHLILYNLQNHRDYHHGYMVPSTGYLTLFDLQNVGVGFVLRFTRRHKPDELLPLPDSKQLFETFIQYGNWLNRLGISSVGALNDAIAEKNIQQVILVSEALQEQKIAEIARNIVTRQEKSHIVLIAGPSSSGKTTFSKRLSIQLLAHGISPFPLEVDNYFVDRDKTPLDENGKYDFEVLEAIDTKLLSMHLKQLIDGQEVQLQHYNFKTGASESGDVVRLQKGQMIILEGIHGLNPRLLPGTPPGETIRLYVSCLTQLNLDRYNRISTTDTRLIRRIIRDARERGYSAQDTIQRWESVRRGEKRHIFPFQDNADEMFNSALVYELSALKPYVEPLLRQVPFGTMEYIESKRLLAFLDWFLPIDEDLIPENSILREFIGKSILSDFKLWKS